jgi:tetratricopeptide (TPR) repeat protein
MLRRSLFLLLIAGPALAQAPAPGARAVPTTPAARAAEARRAELDRAFDALRTAPDEAGALLVESRIRALWSQSAGPAVALLVSRGARNVGANLSDEALEDFDAAITLQPDFPEAWYLRAEAYARAGDAAAAGRDLQEVLRLEPRHWAALESLAELQAEAGDVPAAIRSLGAALALNPKLAGGAEKLQEWRRKSEGEAL